MNISFKKQNRKQNSAFTLVEMLVVITIIAVLLAILITSMGKIQMVAESMKNVSNMKQIVGATITFAGDNGGKIPSAEYPGGMEVPSGMSPDDFFPKYYSLVDGSGKWLDGVIFGELYLKEFDIRSEGEDGDQYQTGGYTFDEDGTHLKGTVFESIQSVKKSPEEKDWHKHSYAMNKGLQFDRIYLSENSSDPYLTEKTLSNILYLPNAMIYITCEENIIDFDDRDLVIETTETRWGSGGKAITGFLDGHVDRLAESDIPDEDPESDIQSSRFWRGVDPENR